MYGAIDLEGSSIYPNTQFIKNFQGVPGELSTFQAFDFVTKMYLDAKRNIQIAISMGELVNDNPLISNMEIVRAYESPVVLYKAYLSTVLIEFNEKCLDIFRLHLLPQVKYSVFANIILLFPRKISS